jgi:PST family polysaccharide transporter
MSIRQVSLPAFSRLVETPAAMRTAFLHSLTLTAGLAVLGGVLIATLATPLVATLYGEKWLPAVAALQWLALLGALRVVLELCYDLLVAMGRAAALIRVQVGWLLALAVALPLGAHLGGIAGVAIAQAIVAAAIVLPLNLVLLLRSGLRLRPLVRALQPILVAAAASGVMALVVLEAGASRWALLGGGGVLLTITYVATFLANGRARSSLRWARPSAQEDEGRPLARQAPVPLPNAGRSA